MGKPNGCKCFTCWAGDLLKFGIITPPQYECLLAGYYFGCKSTNCRSIVMLKRIEDLLKDQLSTSEIEIGEEDCCLSDIANTINNPQIKEMLEGAEF